MDLYGGGWFSDPGLWQIWKGGFGNEMRAVHRKGDAYAPEVAVIVDEQSRFYEKFTWSGFYEMYPMERNALQACGTSVGFYYLDDYLEGRIPKTKATVFLNAWWMTPERKKALLARVREVGGTVIWQYAPGYLDPGKGGTAGVKELTGMDVEEDQGRLGSIGSGPLEGISYGGKNPINPRIIITDTAATPLSHYSSDQRVSAAEKDENGVHHILLADDNWSADMIQRLLVLSGVKLEADHPAVVQSNKEKLFVYALQAGPLKLHAPDGLCFEDGNTERTVDLKQNEDRLFALKHPGK
jgi:hypothetical protein